MTWLDITICLILARSVFIGFRKGVFYEFFKIAGVLLGLILGFVYSEYFGTGLAFTFNLAPAAGIIPIFILLWISSIAAFAFIRILVIGFMKIESVGPYARLGGVFLGGLRGLLISAVIILIMSTIPMEHLQQVAQEQTYFGRMLYSTFPRTCEKVLMSFPWVK